MNIFILLLSLLSPYYSAPAQQESISIDSFSRPASARLAFQNTPVATPYISRFDSLAGVRLFATEDELLQKKGTPLQIVEDPWQGCLEYQYENMSAGVLGSEVLYVHVSPSQAQRYGLFLNEVELDPAKNNLQELLGAPDFKAEDGDVYMRGNTALKIYRDTDTGKWLGIDLFDENSS
ncbi:hypothetical protein PaeBR_20525 [Paenibacillus sp. BR2-3]|uniref:hypothetical protein n=1 Tax=Paenibacillus sp. BR2-3 TaxID=3048494 RepID=UPI0039777129